MVVRTITAAVGGVAGRIGRTGRKLGAGIGGSLGLAELRLVPRRRRWPAVKPQISAVR
jgi:hypothetical protein